MTGISGGLTSSGGAANWGSVWTRSSACCASWTAATLPCEQVREIALEHAQEVRDKIVDLKRMERTLRDTAAQCEGGETPDCPIIDVLFDGK